MVVAVASALGLGYVADARADEKPRPKWQRPRLQLAAGPVLGPHVRSEDRCLLEDGGFLCESAGGFLGFGFNLELRGQLYKWLYGHLRGSIVGNTLRLREAGGAYTGMFSPGIGLGAYARLAFLRAEYVLVLPFGDNFYSPPYSDDPDAGTVELGYHAALISAGVRIPVAERTGVELWGGLMIGPRVHRRSIHEDATGDTTQLTFLAGVNVTFDLLTARTRATPTAGQGSAQPGVTQPAAQPQPVQPYATQPQPAQQQPVQPGVAQPQPVQPQPVQPGVTRPVQPQPAQPGVTRPGESQP